MPEDKISFVPQRKTESLSYKQEGPGFLFVSSLVIFLLSLLAYGGLLFYKNNVSTEINDLTTSLDKAKAAFELPLINQLKEMSDKIDSAKTLLERHISPTSVLVLLEKDIVRQVRLKSLNFDAGEDGLPIITAEGVAPDYKTLAQQGDVFDGDKNIIKNSFSGLELSEKGTVNFTTKISLDKSFITYKAAE